MPRFSRRTLVVLALAGALAGCSGLDSMNAPGGSGSVAVGSEAPDASGRDADGHGLKLADFRGKVVMLSFWANF